MARDSMSEQNKAQSEMYDKLDEALRDPYKRVDFEQQHTGGCSCLYLDGELQPFHEPTGCVLHGLTAPKQHPNPLCRPTE
jgi:hypothetical protein